MNRAGRRIGGFCFRRRTSVIKTGLFLRILKLLLSQKSKKFWYCRRCMIKSMLVVVLSPASEELERTHRNPSLGSKIPVKTSAESTCIFIKTLHSLPLCSPLLTASLQRCSSSVSMTALVTPLGYCCKICMVSLLLQLKGGQRKEFFSQKSHTASQRDLNSYIAANWASQ